MSSFEKNLEKIFQKTKKQADVLRKNHNLKRIGEHSESTLIKRKSDGPGINELKIATILDKFSYECFKYECNVIPVDVNNWENTLSHEKPDFLLVQSAWSGNDGRWQYKISDLHKKRDDSLKELVKWCRQQSMPTVFWNKEDPYHFDAFIEAAKLFDYVFTTDSESISKYVNILGHNRVYVLPFAVQPKIHNPIDKDKEKIGKVAFAGTWYRVGHEERKKDMEIILKPARKYGLHIYDRMYHYTKSNNYQYPEMYQPFIKGSVTYEEMCLIYKKYDVFLNVNTIQNSPTMFSSRVLELLACGTNVISGYAKGIENMLPNLVKLCRTEEETTRNLELLLHHKEIRDRLSMLGQREVFEKHTYKHRIEMILEKIRINYKKEEIPGISIIAYINHLSDIDSILTNYERQTYEKKELIIVSNSPSIELDNWNGQVSQYSNVKIFQLDKKKLAGECLNFGIKHSNYDYIAIFNNHCYYGSEYLRDLMHAFIYSDADIVGKYTYYIYLKGSKTLAIRFTDMENRFVKFLSPSSLMIKREVFHRLKFTPNSNSNEAIIQFLKICVKKNFKMYATNRFNYVYTLHTTMPDEASLRDCKIVAYTDDYITHATI